MLARAVFEVLWADSPQAEERLGRKYTLIIQSDETSHYLTIYRTGKERPSTVHANVFASLEELLADAREKIMRRFNHGYSLTWWDETFPFLDWISQRGYRRERRDIMPPPVQLHLPLHET
ncbi:MAG: hypothetical protein L0154_30715 [Chloroflexi bacterium]|nr:hypothetical protein [Chloroflexota bacterium]